MTFARGMLTIFLAISLAILPVRAGGSGGSYTAVSSIASAATGDMMPMPDECDQTGDHGKPLPGACSAHCNNLPVLPTVAVIIAETVLISVFGPAVGTLVDGIDVSPEPHPPKFA